MDLNYSADELAFRDEVRGWLRSHLPATCATRSSRYATSTATTCCAGTGSSPRKGWVAPAWPTEWGGTGWNVVQRYIFEEECGYAGAPPLVPFGLAMCAPVLLQFGTDAQKQRFLPRIYRGDDFWCQGYSEPGSGSDLASLRTRAVRQRRPLRRQRPEDLDHARALSPTGSSAWCAPTPRCERKQEGISFLLIDMKTPGITVRPLDADGRRPRGQRGVLRRRGGAGREPRARRGQGLDRRQVPARPRAHEHRAHRHLASASSSS